MVRAEPGWLAKAAQRITSAISNVHVQPLLFRTDASDLPRDQSALSHRRFLHQWLAIHWSTTCVLLRSLSTPIRQVGRNAPRRHRRLKYRSEERRVGKEDQYRMRA